MKKIEKLIKDIATDVENEMRYTIESGFDRMTFETEFLDGLLIVEIDEIRLRNGMCIDNVDVFVQHEDSEKSSPNIEKAIKDALPDWFDLKHEIEKQIA